MQTANPNNPAVTVSKPHGAQPAKEPVILKNFLEIPYDELERMNLEAAGRRPFPPTAGGP